MRTVAITIGINEYYGSARLDNAVNDATAMADVFRRLGYEVLLYTDCISSDFGNILDEFQRKLGDAEASIFYFAGHGFELQGENFLAGTDCQVANPSWAHCNRSCIRLSELMEIYKAHSEKVNIVIIDACRRSFQRGAFSAFTSVKAPTGTLIGFSTSPGEGAKDGGSDGHSIYTGALLRYIGRERLSVEKLFKNVRKTVYHLTAGAQTTWEHSSLIGDFYFNEGQLIHSLDIPYERSVVKDHEYIARGEFGRLINDLKSSNWDRQNPAVEKFKEMPSQALNPNQLFLTGRNILQASNYAFSATDFVNQLKHRLPNYQSNGENHLLNGMLFEMYFDSKGEYRFGNFKKHAMNDLFSLRHNPTYRKSFEFIARLLAPYRDTIFYVPSTEDDMIDVNILVNPVEYIDFGGRKQLAQLIEKIDVAGKDLTQVVRGYDVAATDEKKIKRTLANVLTAPEELVTIHSNIRLTHVGFTIRDVDGTGWY